MAEPELPSSSSLENVNATVSRFTAASSLGLFDAQTPRTSAAVRGRWTPEYAVIKMALMRQSAAKPKVCFCIKSVKLMLSRDVFHAATQACASTLPELSKLHLNTTFMMQINSCRSQLCETIQARGGQSTYQYTEDKKGPKQENRLAATARAACDAFSKASQLFTPVSAYPNRKAKPQLWGPSVVASTEEAVAKSSAAFAASRDFIASVVSAQLL